jgi:response regulator RpfG family c-di-GMP phosphodiesterase
LHQVASALAETHKFQLVHRDIKPSNILLAGEDQAKLLDFGLMRDFDTRLTEPGAILGTIDYMAPEQAQDASQVDIRADLYGLGGTLYWCLTGRLPFPPEGSVMECLTRRLTQPPPSVREFAPEVPPALEAVVARLLATKPKDRYADPPAVMRALLPFLRPERGYHELEGYDPAVLSAPSSSSCTYRLLIVDDEPGMREFCSHVLQAENSWCDTAGSGEEALKKLHAAPCDLVLLDVNLLGMSGPEVLRRLRESPPSPHLKILMCSGAASSDEMAEMLLAGADDYLTKPFSVIQLSGRVQAALRLKDAQDRSALLNRHLLAINAELERNLTSRDSDLVGVRNTLVLALSRLVEQRDTESHAHLLRMQRYARCLAEAAASTFGDQIDGHFIELLECCVPLHDIGKVGLPDHILMKPGKLSSDERILMQAHTTIGAETLREAAPQHGSSVAFLQMALDIIRHHHERYDGHGYPDRLAGSSIPLAARIVTLGDVYDALRSRRIWKPALSHNATLHLMIEDSHGQFDPALLQVFRQCASEFEAIYRKFPD